MPVFLRPSTAPGGDSVYQISAHKRVSSKLLHFIQDYTTHDNLTDGGVEELTVTICTEGKDGRVHHSQVKWKNQW